MAKVTRPSGLPTTSQRFAEITNEQGQRVRVPVGRNTYTEIYLDGELHCVVLVDIDDFPKRSQRTAMLELTKLGQGISEVIQGIAHKQDVTIESSTSSKYARAVRKLHFTTQHKLIGESKALLEAACAWSLPITQDVATLFYVTDEQGDTPLQPNHALLDDLSYLQEGQTLTFRAFGTSRQPKPMKVLEVFTLISVSSEVANLKGRSVPYSNFGQLKRLVVLEEL